MDNTIVLRIVPVILIVLMLGILSFIRLKIPRDTSKEGSDDYESVQAYDSVSRWPLFSIIRYRVLQQLERHQPQGILLDIGCGPGYLDRALATRFPRLQILGVDISKEALDLAIRNQSLFQANSWISYQEGDIDQLPFESNSVDFIVSTLSLHHLTKPQEALQEIYRVLKPRGQLLIFDLRRDMPRLLFYLIRFGQHFFAPHPIQRTNGGEGSVWSSFTPAEMKTLLCSSFPTWEIQSGWGWFFAWGMK